MDRIAGQDFHQVVEPPGHLEQASDLRHHLDGAAKFPGLAGALGVKLDEDHRLELGAEGGVVDVGVKSPQDACALQTANPTVYGGWCQPDGGPELFVGPPPILLEQAKQSTVDRIQGDGMGRLVEFHSVAPFFVECISV